MKVVQPITKIKHVATNRNL